MADIRDLEYYHHQRVCLNCGYTWWGLHCPHDGYQNPCGDCGETPEPVVNSDKCECELVAPVAELEQLIKEKQAEARLKERKRMSQDLEEFSDWAFVNYPHHELEKAIKGFWRENADRIAELEGEE